MPTYDYHCEKCGKDFEIWQSMNDKRLTKCPEKGCGGKIQRKIGVGAGFVFKGSGFYITDYRSDSYKAAAKSDSAAASPPAASGDSGSSSAPAPAEKKATPAESAAKTKPKKAKAAD